jgi:plastocyanin
MKHMSPRRTATVVLIGAMAFVTACGGDDDSAADSCETDDTVVTVVDNTFEPQELEVVAGTTVCWSNEGRIQHNVIPDEGDLFRLETFDPGEVFRHTFEDAGEYPYYCSFHGTPGIGQWGSVTVTG